MEIVIFPFGYGNSMSQAGKYGGCENGGEHFVEESMAPILRNCEVL